MVKINEIQSIPVPLDWDPSKVNWIGKDTSSAKKIGKIGKYPLIFEYKDEYKSVVSLVDTDMIAHPNGYNVVAQIDLRGGDEIEPNQKYWITKATVVTPRYRGKNLAARMYAMLCKRGLILRSDDQQTYEGKKIWILLSKIPGIVVYAGKENEHTNQWELSDIDNDVDDFLRSNFQTYDIDDNYEETEILKKEIAQGYKISEKLNNMLIVMLNDPSKQHKVQRLKQELDDVAELTYKKEAELSDLENSIELPSREYRDVYLFAVADTNKIKVNKKYPFK